MGCQNKKELDEVEKIYQNIVPHLLEVNRAIYGSLLEFDQETIDENGSPYLILNDPNYKELIDIELLLKSAFSERYISEEIAWVLNGDVPLYKEINGKLCTAMTDAVGGSIPREVTAVIKKENDIIIFEGVNEEERFEVTLVKSEERWVIDQMNIE